MRETKPMTSYFKLKQTLLYLFLFMIFSQGIQGSAKPLAKPLAKPTTPAASRSSTAPKPLVKTPSASADPLKTAEEREQELATKIDAFATNPLIETDAKTFYDNWTSAENDAIAKTKTWEKAEAALQEAKQNPPEFGKM